MRWMGGWVILAAIAAAGSAADLPVIDGKETVATVNGEPITVEELFRQVGIVHRGVEGTEDRLDIPDPTALLERVINVKLILQEARAIGLDELPEFARRMDRLRVGLLRRGLVREQVEEIAEADPEEVERLYREAVREWKLDSLLFGEEEDAHAFSDRIEEGGEFERLAAEAIEAGKARGEEEGRFLKATQLLPEVARVVATLEPCQVSVPIRVPEGFAIVKLYSVRHPDDPDARRQAEEDALEARRQERLERYVDGLREKYTEVDRELLESLDFESREPGLEKLRNDPRTVAKVKGGAPVTVADLTAAIEKKYYHGLEGAIERKRVNPDLPLILDRLLMERVTLREARRLGIEQTEEFRQSLRELEENLLFGVFLSRVINPDIRVEDGELERYYERHLDEYSSPRMLRIESLAFSRRGDAEAALEKLRRGADLDWMRANAPRQASRETHEGLLVLQGRFLVASGLPEGVRKAVAGAAAGDFRFFGPEGGPFYVLAVREVREAEPRPFGSVRDQIAAEVTGLKRQAAVEEWAEKLRAASEVEVFATGGELAGVLGLGIAEGSDPVGEPEGPGGAVEKEGS